MADQEHKSFGDMPTVDFKSIGKPVLNDMSEDRIGIDMSKQPEIVLAALEAIKNIDIPNADLTVYEHQGDIVISKDADTLLEAEGIGTSFRDVDVAFENAVRHTAGVSINIEPNEDGGYRVGLKARHDGSYDSSNLDASSSEVSYDVTADGSFTNRKGSASTEETGVSAADQEHGSWTMQAAQTLESNFSRILGQDFEGRPENAATQVGQPPAADNAVALSSINLDAMIKGNEPAADLDTEPSAIPQP